MARPIATYIPPRYAASGFVNPIDPLGLLSGGPFGMPIGPQDVNGQGSGVGPGAIIPSTAPGAIYGPPVQGGMVGPTAPATRPATTTPSAPQAQAPSAHGSAQHHPVAQAPIVPAGPTSQPSISNSSWVVFFALAAGLGGAAALSYYYDAKGR